MADDDDEICETALVKYLISRGYLEPVNAGDDDAVIAAFENCLADARAAEETPGRH